MLECIHTHLVGCRTKSIAEVQVGPEQGEVICSSVTQNDRGGKDVLKYLGIPNRKSSGFKGYDIIGEDVSFYVTGLECS